MSVQINVSANSRVKQVSYFIALRLSFFICMVPLPILCLSLMLLILCSFWMTHGHELRQAGNAGVREVRDGGE